MSDTAGATNARPLKVPAILLLCLSASWGVLLVVMTILTNAGVVQGQGVNIGLGTGADPALNLVLSIALCIYYLAIAGGALSMARGGSRGLAWVTAIAASIPCCSPWACLGMLPGIWCIVVLSRAPKDPGSGQS